MSVTLKNLPNTVHTGVMALPNRELTEDGFEVYSFWKPFEPLIVAVQRQVGINHLGHFHLTNLMMPLMRKSKFGRIVNVSSSAHKFAPKGLELDNFQGEKEYGAWKAYGKQSMVDSLIRERFTGQSKLANILFTRELQNKFVQKNGWVHDT